MRRYVVYVDGKWQGGSFASPKEADAVGARNTSGTTKKYEVRERWVAEKPTEKPAPSKHQK